MPDTVIKAGQVEDISNGCFSFISAMLKKQSGFILTEDKKYLLVSKLSPLVKKYGMRNLDELINAIKSDENEGIACEVIAAMTINETSFFRDIKPFKALTEIIVPNILASNPDRQIKILCAACATGQEPYSIAMSIEEDTKLAGVDYAITAFDIAHNILDKAIAGEYTQFEVQRGLPVAMLLKYFHKENNLWQINDKIKSKVTFHQFNLLEDITKIGSDFDIIFCRNILIYFDQSHKASILDKLYNILNNNGFIFLGSAESVFGICNNFKNYGNVPGLFIKQL